MARVFWLRAMLLEAAVGASDWPFIEAIPAVVGLSANLTFPSSGTVCNVDIDLAPVIDLLLGTAVIIFLLIFLVLYYLILSLAGSIPLCSVLSSL